MVSVIRKWPIKYNEKAKERSTWNERHLLLYLPSQ